ncbi:MAG: hypothetical protein K2M17_04025 [Bacilli bacterium]|nr:hypothetical protein [Bacilli bacterium]
MKESISMTTLFQIVILFIFLFTAIMCLTINNANAFGVKDEIVNIIELADGKVFDPDDNSRLNDEIVQAISDATYRTTGKCNANGDEDVGYIGYDKLGNPVGDNEKASICIKEVKVTDGINDYLRQFLGDNFGDKDFRPGSYFRVKVFFQMDLPVVNQVYSMAIKGETRIIYDKSLRYTGDY